MSVSLRIGLLRLADSAPVLMAREYGLFAQAGIDVEIVVEPSWANIADGLSWNRLDAAVIFPPLAIMTALGKRGRSTPLQIMADLSCGGNTIVLRDEACLQKTAPRFAVVHSYSTHFLLLRRYLAARSPDALDHLVIMPPDQMLDALRDQRIDGFCAGPPWGTAAERAGLGRIVSGSAAIWPGHLEKQCVVTQAWARQYPSHAACLKNVMEAAIDVCLDPAKYETLRSVLTRSLSSSGLDLPSDAVCAILPGNVDLGNADPNAFSFARADKTSIEPILADMYALGWISDGDDLKGCLQS